MELPNGKARTTVIGALSAIIIALSGYSFDTITTTIESVHMLTVKVGKLESKFDMLLVESSKGARFTQQDGNNLIARIERLELRIDDVIRNAKKWHPD